MVSLDPLCMLLDDMHFGYCKHNDQHLNKCYKFLQLDILKNSCFNNIDIL